MASITAPDHAKKITTKDGTNYGFIHIPGQPSKPNLLFLHGYPSSSFDWRYQIETFSKQGYSIIVPDLLGYGDTDKPTSVKDYAMTLIGAQVFGILDSLNVGPVVGIGHDFGSVLLSVMARMDQSRFLGFAFVAVEYIAHGDRLNLDQINELTTQHVGYPLLGYWKFHEQEDAPEVILKNAEAYLSLVYPHDPKLWVTDLCPIGKVRSWTESGEVRPLPSWLNQEEHDTHTSIIKSGGFAGPLNWYKQTIQNVTWELEKDQTDEQQEIHKPLLFIGASKDYVCIEASGLEHTHKWAKGPFEHVSMDTGHWPYLEKRKEFDQALGAWLEKTFGGK